MAIDHIRYDMLAQEALRGVVRTVLEDAARNGLPGEHHLYITFNTRIEGVRLSPRMLEQYPKEMTIVLQHQFWDLKVTESAFEVGLSFGGIPERLAVPFAAIKGFFDPSVQFGLQFEEIGGETTEAEKPEEGDAPSVGHNRSKRPTAEQVEHAASTLPPAVPAPANPDQSDRKPAGAAAESSAQVVRLDRFRKK